MADNQTEIQKVETTVSADAKEVLAAVEAWFVKHFHGNKISQDTDSFNICQNAKEDLKAIITKTI